MRRLAMNEASDDDSQEDVSDSPAAKSSRKRSVDPGSAQKGKITKIARLAVVVDALTESLKTASEEDWGKYEYKSQRLTFEEEQAKEKRRYDADEAEKRHQHELEGRRKRTT
ncbi:hypothetical protein GQ600_4945 [Phytophthora cactorum]|nr:hypothetical protein GQ600_4945 [Phytophthora cactorum]